MTYDESWEAPSSYWIIRTTDGTNFRVDERTAHRVRDEYERGDRMLDFLDIPGGQNAIVASAFLGTWECSPLHRARDREIGEMLQAEEGETFS